MPIEILVFISDIGYGPVCTTLPILKRLKNIMPNIDLFGFGGDLVYEQCSKSNLFKLFYKIDVKNIEQINNYLNKHKYCSLVISNSNLESVRVSLKYNLNVVFIDILAFLHSQWPEYLKRCKLLIIQDYFSVSEVINKKLKYYPNISLVDSLVDNASQNVIEDYAIISLGGGTFSHHMNNDFIPWYFQIVASIIKGVVQVLIRHEIEFYLCAGSCLASGVQKLANVKIETYSHNEYIDMLGKAKFALITPGLTGINECRQFKRPIFLLPPLNYSQVIQARFAMDNWGVDGITWDNYYRFNDDISALEEVNSNFKLWNSLKFIDLSNLQNEVSSHIQSFITTYRSRNYEYGHFNSGVHDACQRILKLLENNIHMKANNFQIEYISLFLTNKCNANCTFCCYKNERLQKGDYLSLKEISTVINDCPELKFVGITGGEPTLHPEFNNVIQIFANSGNVSEITISTNGSNPDLLYSACKSFLLINNKTRLRIKISLDGPKELHDNLRQNHGLFSKAIRSLQYLLKLSENFQNLIVYSTTAIDGYNIELAKDFLKILRESYHPHFTEILPVRRERSKTENDIFTKQYDELTAAIFNAFISEKSSPTNIQNNQLDLISRKVSGELSYIRGNNKSNYPCIAGSKSIVILHNGDVLPCEYIKQKIINDKLNLNDIDHYSLGNLRNCGININHLMNSHEAEIIRSFILRGCYCDIPCAVRQNIIASTGLA